MYRVLALDPGGTTGWASCEVSPHGEVAWDCSQIGPEKHHKVLYDFLGDRQVEAFTIVCESFEYRNQSRAGLDLSSKEYIGVVELFEQERMQLPLTDQNLVFQTAAMAKGFVSDENIKKLGLWVPGRKHAMDATRHLLYYLTNDTHSMLRTILLKKGWK